MWNASGKRREHEPKLNRKDDPVWISIVFLGIMLWKLVSTNGTSTSQDELSYSDFMAKVDADNVNQ